LKEVAALADKQAKSKAETSSCISAEVTYQTERMYKESQQNVITDEDPVVDKMAAAKKAVCTASCV
jgi:hypothetical protein